MKLAKIILGTALLLNFNSKAQEMDTLLECKRMRLLGQQEVQVKNFKLASMYYLKGEDYCGNYTQKQYNILVATLKNTINTTQEETEKKAYTDTLLAVYDRAEAKNLYDRKNDLGRAAFYLGATSPDNKKADVLFRRGIDSLGVKTNEAYISYFYYNTYVLYSQSTGDEQVALKKRLISEYFELSNLASTAAMSAQTTTNLTSYFNYVVKGCDDILPDLKGYIANLPEDVEVRKLAVKNFISLLEQKECTSAPEYETLVIEYDRIDGSIDSKIALAKLLVAKKQYSKAIAAFKSAGSLTEDADKKMELKYNIASAQLQAGQYKSAYNTAMSITGSNQGLALIIAGSAVGSNANNCGSSTFDRKCNYIYAVQLLQKAKSLGAASGNRISKYTALYPTADEKFDNGNPSTKTLECYGVTVNL